MLCSFNGTLLVSVLPPLLIAEFLLGILGNGLALWIFCLHLKPWRSSTVLLFNLALADFLLNAALPFRAAYYLSGIRWRFGEAFCNVTLFLLATNRSGSTFFLAAVAVDRYVHVVHPHHPINSLGVGRVWCLAAGLWLLAVSSTAPILALRHTNTSLCESFRVETDHAVTWHTFYFLFSFYMPLALILFCTVSIVERLRSRPLVRLAKVKKALCSLLVVVALFVICFLPSNITQLLIWNRTWTMAAAGAAAADVCAALEDLTSAFYVTISMTYLNSMLDPLVYYFSSSQFQNVCRKALRLPETSAAESTERKTRESGTQSFDGL